MAVMGDSLSDLASSDNGEDGEDENKETEQGKLSEDDKPSWVMGTISQTVHQRMKSFRLMQLNLDELTQSEWEDAADYFREWDKKYGTAELRVPVVVQPQTDDDALAPPPTTFGELMERLDIVPGISWMPGGTSRPGSGHIGLGSVKPLSNTSISGLEPAVEPDTSPWRKAKPVEPVIFCHCILPTANHHIDFGRRRRHADGSCVSGGIERQSVIFDVICLWKAICLPILRSVRYFLISVTKLWDMIIRLCLCKGRMHHVKVLKSESGEKTADTFNLH